jgi:hypothetical protein
MGVKEGLAVEAQEILDALPMLAMVLDENHRIVMSNSWFAENTGDREGECPIACYERVHGTDHPHPDCPLVEAARSGKAIQRDLIDSVSGSLAVTVVPFKGRFGSERLFLHLTQMR